MHRLEQTNKKEKKLYHLNFVTTFKARKILCLILFLLLVASFIYTLAFGESYYQRFPRARKKKMSKIIENGFSKTGQECTTNGSSTFLQQVTELILNHNLVGKEVRSQNDSLVKFMKPQDLEVRSLSVLYCLHSLV